MRRNADAYYRALENMINNSRFNAQMLSEEGQNVLGQVFHRDWFHVKMQNGQKVISYQKVQEINQTCSIEEDDETNSEEEDWKEVANLWCTVVYSYNVYNVDIAHKIKEI